MIETNNMSTEVADFWAKKKSAVKTVSSSTKPAEPKPKPKQAETTSQPKPENPAPKETTWKEFDDEQKRVNISRLTGKKMVDLAKYFKIFLKR